MFRDTIIWISEVLFYLLNGEPLLNTIWIFVWIFGGTVILLIPYYLAFSVGKNKARSFPAIVFLVSFFPILLLIMGPPIVQAQMISECENITVTVNTDRVELHTVEMRQCRAKENFYGEFGEWRIVPQSG
jgi:hypothetical protein